MVHRAFFAHGYQGRQQFFIKVTNLSPQREVELTHLWFETDPPTQILNNGQAAPRATSTRRDIRDMDTGS